MSSQEKVKPLVPTPSEKKKIAIIGTVGLPAKYGGFETLVDRIARPLLNNHEVHVYCSGKEYDTQPDEIDGISLHYIPLRANGIASIPYDLVSMISAARYADTMLILGVSGCLFLPLVRLFTKSRVVTNVDGIEWRRDKWNAVARRFLKFSEKMAVKCSDTVIADNGAISEYLSAEYGSDSVCIAYGGDHARKTPVSSDALARHSFLSAPYAVKVCRVEPENNVRLIVDAFSKIPEKTLVVIGNWDSSEYGKSIKQDFSDHPNLHILDPIYEPDELGMVRGNAETYIHGHSAGGTNPSLVEAMHLGLPIIAFDVNFNRVTTHDSAAYFSTQEQLIEKMRSLTKPDLEALGAKMSAIAEDHYRWSIIASKYEEVI